MDRVAQDDVQQTPAAAANAAAAGLYLRAAQRRPIPLAAELACGAGELLALVGPSGSGKTTLLRVIAGLATPASGEVRCAGANWYDSARGIELSPQKRRVGFVFQHYALFPHLSAEANVAMALGELPPAARRPRARELLALMHLSGLEQRLPRELSGGQQQRVAVARALARDPAVLLLDEPFSAVDQVTRRKLQRELVRLREQLRIPIVLVTHDLDEARMLADRIAILHKGATLQVGPPDEVMLRPASPTVARLVELTNLFEGTVDGAGPGGRLYLRWGARVLEVRAHPGVRVGERVDWVVPSPYVLLHRADRPSRGERENPVSGVCAECMMMGDAAAVTLAVDAGPALVFSLPAHVVRRQRVAPGARLTVSLLAEGIHLMQRVAGGAPAE